MFLHDLKFSLRMMIRNKWYAVISILGLSLGISCCVLIGLFVLDELSFDRFHKDGDRLYRVTTMGQDFTAGLSNMAFGPTVKQDYPEVEDYCRMLNFGNKVEVQQGDIKFNENAIWFADSSFFNLFSFQLLEGDPQTCLTGAKTIVLSESLAQRYFGDDSPIGKALTVNRKEYTVTGVMEDDPGNSDIKYNALVSFSSLLPSFLEPALQDWFWITGFTYLKLTHHIAPADFQDKLDQISEKYVKPWGEANGTTAMNTYHIQLMQDVHFDNTLKFDTPKGNKSYVYILSLVALFLLVIACINFINLSLAQSTKRAKEIGVRKTLGAEASAIRRQFFAETIITTLVAFFVGLVLVELLIPGFNDLAAKQFDLTIIFTPASLLLSLGIIGFIAIAAASYPGLVLSRFDPVEVLKGALPSIGSVGVVRKVLIVVQFAFAIAMIFGTLVVVGQVDYMKGRDLGYSQEQQFVFRVPSDTNVTNRLDVIQQKFEQHPSVESTTISGNLPGGGFGEYMFRVEQEGVLEDATVRLMAFDDQYIDQMNMELLEGRNFDPNMGTDPTQAFIINEATVKEFGWGDKALGKRMQFGLFANDSAQFDGKVIGVVKDFHFQSLHNPIEPLAIQYQNTGGNFLTAKISGNVSETVEALKADWAEFDPGRIQETLFMDERFNQAYQSEERMLTIFSYFTLLSILISVLGLFAVTSFMVKQRTKEMGIRKVLGASLGDVLRLISKEFLLLVLIGFVIATPIATYFLLEWLDEFAYSLTLGPQYFIVTALIIGVVAFSVIAWHAFQASKADPVVALKYE